MLGRILGGIATSLLFSAFESWLVAEHNKVRVQCFFIPYICNFSLAHSLENIDLWISLDEHFASLLEMPTRLSACNRRIIWSICH